MSIDVIANVARDNMTLFSNQLFQIDRMTMMEAMTYSLPPHFSYDGYVLGPLDLRQNDYLIDTINTDPVTTRAKTYQVVNEPERFPDGHIEFMCIRADRSQITRGT